MRGTRNWAKISQVRNMPSYNKPLLISFVYPINIKRALLQPDKRNHQHAWDRPTWILFILQGGGT